MPGFKSFDSSVHSFISRKMVSFLASSSRQSATGASIPESSFSSRPGRFLANR